MGMRRADVASYFAARSDAGLEERRRALAESPESCFGWTSAAELALVGLEQRLADARLSARIDDSLAGAPRFLQLASTFEPDLLLLSGTPPLVVALAVTAPSGWAPEHALGRTVRELHAVVPGLEPQVGTSVHTFLHRLTPGAAYERDNWGLTVGDALDRHPRHRREPLGPTSSFESVYLRVERQLLWGVAPAALLFAIRIEHTPLVALSVAERHALARQLRTMPEAVARYKGLGPDRTALLRDLEHGANFNV